MNKDINRNLISRFPHSFIYCLAIVHSWKIRVGVPVTKKDITEAKKVGSSIERTLLKEKMYYYVQLQFKKNEDIYW